MDNWDYQELIDAIQDTYQEFLDEGMSPIEAASRCMGEFESAADEGYCERIIVYASGVMLYSEIATIMPIGLHSAYRKALDSFAADRLTNNLSNVEAEDLIIRVRDARCALDKMKPYDLCL